MQAIYVRCNQAFHYTVEYYTISRIHQEIKRLSGESIKLISVGGEKEQTHDQWVISIQRDMENEILQNINTLNENALRLMFEQLRDLLTDYRIESLAAGDILYDIDEYNDRTYQEFANKIEKKEKEFRDTHDYKTKEHNKEYPVESLNSLPATMYEGKVIRKTTTMVKYVKFFCNYESADLIDRGFLHQYFSIVESLINNYKAIINKYLNLFDSGKIKANTTIQIITGSQQYVLEHPQKLLEPLKESVHTHKKLSVNITVPQLAYLFSILSELKPDVFDTKSKTELYEFVANNFVTKATKEKGISIDSFKNNFVDPDRKTVDYWIDLLKRMLELSRKKFN